MFAIDPRSLAAFRIGVALLLFCDLFYRAADLNAFYTDQGLVSRIVRLEMLDVRDPLGFQHQWSLHMLNGELWSQATMFGVAAWFSAWLLIGYRTQLAAVACWLLFLSLDNRNPLILDAGDSILRALMFWSLFLPLGLRWSVDQRRATALATESHPLSSVLTAALLLQLAIMYLASAAFKWNPVWTQECSAVYYALNNDTFVTRWGLLLRDYPIVMQWLTVGTVVLELGGPLLAFSPWKNAYCRCIAIAAFISFHAGLAVTLTINLFPWICITGWLLFIPAAVWDWLARQRIARTAIAVCSRFIIANLARTPPSWQGKWFPRPEQPRSRSGWCRQALVGFLFLYIALWNVREVLGPAWIDRIMPHRYNGLAMVLGLQQNWSMFAPIPRREDGWLVMKGTLQDGTEVNLWAPGEPLPWTKPDMVSAMYPTSRWRRYLENIVADQYAFFRQYLADWLKHRWDEKQSGGVEAKRIVKVEIIRQLEFTPPPGDPPPQSETVELCVRHYER